MKNRTINILRSRAILSRGFNYLERDTIAHQLGYNMSKNEALVQLKKAGMNLGEVIKKINQNKKN